MFTQNSKTQAKTVCARVTTVAAINNNNFKAAEGIKEIKAIRSSKSPINWFAALEDEPVPCQFTTFPCLW